MLEKNKNKPSSLPITFPSVVLRIMKTKLEKSYSGALRHYFKNREKGLLNMKPAKNQVVNLPKNEVINYFSKVKCHCLQCYPKSSCVKDIHIVYIIYLVQSFDDDCTAILD